VNSIFGPRQITQSPITKRYSRLFDRKTELLERLREGVAPIAI
jgi:hypothetical protein